MRFTEVEVIRTIKVWLNKTFELHLDTGPLSESVQLQVEELNTIAERLKRKEEDKK